MQLTLYTTANYDQMVWPKPLVNTADQQYLHALMTAGTQAFIDNVAAEMVLLQANDTVIPLVLGNSLRNNSYVCSNMTHYIDYAIVEMDIELGDRPHFKKWAARLLRGCGWVFERCGIEQVVFVNNWLLSTNLYPPLQPSQIKTIRDFLCQSYPDRAIVFKSVNTRLTADLLSGLQQAGFLAVISRQVYILDPATKKHTQHDSWRRDCRVKRKTTYRWRDSSQLKASDIERLKELYDDLYIRKYSLLNPQFNAHFIAQAIRQDWLKIFALGQDDRIDAMIGYVVRDGILTTPMVGYDCSLPQSLGLYRLAVLKTLEDAESQGLILHQSSGAADFKRSRGAEAALEYNMVYVQHLPWRQQLPWSLLQQLSQRVMIPLLQRYQL